MGKKIEYFTHSIYLCLLICFDIDHLCFKYLIPYVNFITDYRTQSISMTLLLFNEIFTAIVLYDKYTLQIY